MGTAKTAKERLLGDKQSRIIDAKLAKALQDYKAEGDVTQEKTDTKFDYWHAKYIEELESKRDWKKIAVKREGDNNALRGDIESLKAELGRQRKEVKRLRAKLTTFEDAAQDEEDEDEYETGDNGRYRAENGFDQRDHCREM